MTGAVTVVLNSKQRRERAARWVWSAPGGAIVSFTEPKRTLPQNARLHAMLTDIARQIEWAGKKRTVEAWKDIFTAALLSATHELDVVPGLNGGFVLLGLHTSSLSKAQFQDLFLLVEAFGAEHGVEFSEPESEAAA